MVQSTTVRWIVCWLHHLPIQCARYICFFFFGRSSDWFRMSSLSIHRCWHFLASQITSFILHGHRNLLQQTFICEMGWPKCHDLFFHSLQILQVHIIDLPHELGQALDVSAEANGLIEIWIWYPRDVQVDMTWNQSQLDNLEEMESSFDHIHEGKDWPYRRLCAIHQHLPKPVCALTPRSLASSSTLWIIFFLISWGALWSEPM